MVINNVGLRLFNAATLITTELNIKNLRLETKGGIFSFNGPSGGSILKVVIDSLNSAVSLGTNVMDLIINNADSISISVKLLNKSKLINHYQKIIRSELRKSINFVLNIIFFP